MWRRDSASTALLLCVLAALSCAAQQKQSPREFVAVLIDAASKKPVPSVRITLAPKKDGTGEREQKCTIDPSLTGVSNDRGEVRVPDVGPGEYVVFQSPSRLVQPVNEWVVTWFTRNSPQYDFSFGAVVVKKGTLAIVGGKMVIVNGYMEGYPPGGVLGISTTAEGDLLTVRVPSAGNAPLKIEINPAPSEPSPPQGAPKSGQ